MRIAVADLVFSWPPDGGAAHDLEAVLKRLAQAHEVRLFVPDVRPLPLKDFGLGPVIGRTKFYLRGKVEGALPFPVTRVPLNALSLSSGRVGPAFRKAVEAFKPDRVWVSDGWYLKPDLMQALAGFKPIMRIYAHENLCLKGNGFFYRKGRICELDYLASSAAHARCLACALRFYAGYPSPRWVHEFLAARAFLPSFAERVRKALSIAERVIVYNHWIGGRIRKYARAVDVVPSGVDVSRFDPAPPAQVGPTRLLFSGRLEPRKGIGTLLEALRLLRKERNDFELHLTGDTSRGDDFVKPLGWRPPEEIPALYQSADICLAPSRWPEPHGIVAVEAMAAGRPVVATTVGGLKDVVVDGETGFTVPPGDASALANRIRELLDSRALRLEMGEKGRKRAEEVYDWDKLYRRYYEPLFAEKPS